MTTVSKSPIRLRKRGWLIAAVLALLLSSYTADSVASIGRVRSGVSAGSLRLGGRTVDESRRLLTARARLLSSSRVDLFADTRRETVSPSDIGFVPEIKPTLAGALAVGRAGNVFVRIWHRVRSLFTSTNVGWKAAFDRSAAERLVRTWSREIDTDGHEAGIQAVNDTLVGVGAVPNRRLNRGAAIGAIVQGFERWPRESMELPITVVARHTNLDDARAAAEEANRWVRSPIDLVQPDGSHVTLSKTELASMVEAVPRQRARGWDLQVRFSPQRVAIRLGNRMTPFEHDARSASFNVGGQSVSVVAGTDGRRFDPAATATELGQAAQTDSPRTATARFAPVKPNLSTADAQALHIKELVSSYTTYHPCCAPRVTNIHKIADIVDGAIVRPGEQFSLNGYVGPRTTEKGFVMAPMIADGKYKDEIGGGVSQFATTTFNAIFYGGYEIDYHQAHSYWISRYPAGRDATVSWTDPDLRFTNDSHAGILIKTSYSGTSLTVSFYGDKEGKVVSDETGPRQNYTDPQTQYEANPALKPGEQHVKQAGEQGFDINVVRVIFQSGKTTRQNFYTKYLAEPKIIEVAPGAAPCASPPPGASPCPTPSGSPGPGQTPTPAKSPHPAASPAP